MLWTIALILIIALVLGLVSSYVFLSFDDVSLNSSKCVDYHPGSMQDKLKE
jgi:hypothetical protein